jgi:hypothetical protein
VIKSPTPLGRALKAHNKAKNLASILRQEIVRLRAQNKTPYATINSRSTTPAMPRKIMNADMARVPRIIPPAMVTQIAKNKENALARRDAFRSLRNRYEAVFGDVEDRCTSAPVAWSSPEAGPSWSEIFDSPSKPEIQLDEFGLPPSYLLCDIGLPPTRTSLIAAEPCISTVSLEGKSLEEINRLWLADVKAKTIADPLSELNALMRL